MNRKPFCLFLASALGSLFLMGCGNDPHPKPLQEKRADGSPWQVSYSSLGDDPRTLDPQVSYDTLGNAIISQIYESLLQYHPFKVDPYELAPCLAESMPERVKEPDGSESYLFKLKHGIYFHDDPCFQETKGIGREVIANDIEYAFKRIADPKVECPVLSTLQEYIVGLKEAYGEAKKTGSFDYSKPLPAIEIIDRYTFRLKMLKPYPQVLYWIAMPFTAPVPHEAVDYYDGKDEDGTVREQFKFHPVGTGAFRLAKWARGRHIRLVRNDRYNATIFPSEGWPTEDEQRFKLLSGKALPFLDEIQYIIIRENIPRWLLFRQGYLDGAGVNKDVFNTVLNVSQELSPKYKERGVQLHKDSDPSTFYLIFNMEDSILGKNRKLRQAISTAYDVDLENAIFRNGIDLNAQQLLPPGLFGYQPDFKNPYKQHDLVLARSLMTQAGYPNGRNVQTGEQLMLSLDVTSDDAESRQLAEFHKNQIEQLGIRVKIEENLWARQQEKVDAGHFQIVAYGWHADFPDPENFFFLFHSGNIPPRGSNSARYSNPEFDRLFQQMSTMDNTPERLELVHQLNAILTEDCPYVILTHPINFSLRQPWAPRVSSNPLLAGGAKYMHLDAQLRSEKQREWNRISLWPIWVGICMVGVCIGYGISWSRRQNV